MKFNFFVIGLGQIGCSLSLALKKRKIANMVFGKDIKRRNFYKNIIDEYVEDLEEGVERSDFIILSTPVIQIIKLINEISPLLSEDKILLDTGSTKKEILKEMEKHNGKTLIGGHPMAGSIKKGENAINENLFEGKLFFLCFPNGNSRRGGKLIKEIIRRIGAVPYEVDPEIHDLYTSIVSHLPYLLSLSLYSIFQDIYKNQKEIENFISTGFIGSTRLALTEPGIGEDILITNKSNIIEQIDILIQKLEDLKDKIEKNEISNFIYGVKRSIERRREKYENFGL